MADLARPLDAAPPRAAAVSHARYYTLALLTLIYGLNFLDRTIFNVLIEPIKKEFQLSDTMLGLLAGFGFVLMYSALGMPIARLAMQCGFSDAAHAARTFRAFYGMTPRDYRDGVAETAPRRFSPHNDEP